MVARKGVSTTKTSKAKTAPQEKNKATAAFAEYKKRMDQHYAEHTAANDARSAPPPLPRAAQEPPVTGDPPENHEEPARIRPPGDTVSDNSGALFERVGEALRLGVDILNISLSNGLQLMQGLSGAQHWHETYPEHYPSHLGSCCEHCHTHYSQCHSCCESCHCNPSVGNCC